MEKQFIADRAKKKKKALKGAWIIVIIAIVFIIVFVKLAMSGGGQTYFNGLPSPDEAYSAAKEIIRPTVKTGISFPESGYQFGKHGDSVYLIKSYYESSDDVKTNYEIEMKYNGGSFTNANSWSVLNLQQGL